MTPQKSMRASDAVREQYEDYPYPHRNPADERTRILHPYLASCEAVNQQCFNGRQTFENFRVLIAGGGTGDTTVWWAEQLRDKPGSSVTYLDISAGTAAVAKERVQIRKLSNVEWIQDSLLNIPQLNLGLFDFIDCSGVLHHLQDPDAGLRALVSALKPDGGMSLMVYAPYGRAGVYQMQSLLRIMNKNETGAARKLANAKAVLKALPPHNIYNLIKKNTYVFADELDDAGIYDLLLHSQDRAYTILETHQWLERCGLKMADDPGTRYTQEEYEPEKYIKDPAALEAIGKLPLPERQAIGEALSGAITRHEFLAVRQGKKNHRATCDDMDMIPYCGSFAHYKPQQLAQFCRERNDEFFIEVKGRNETRINIPLVPFRCEILNAIDGAQTIRAIVEDINGDRAEVMRSFAALFKSLNRGNMLYLRHPSVPLPPDVRGIHQRMTDVDKRKT